MHSIGRRAISLNRERVIEAAIAIADRDGADALSLRALASELGVTPMALYNHVADKRDLLVSAADRILAKAKFNQGETHWRLQIEGCFRALRQVCIQHPGTARLMEIEGVAPNAVFGPMGVTLVALSTVGLQPKDAMRAYFTLVSFTLAQVSYQTRGPFSHLDPAEAIRKQNLPESLVELVREALPDSSSWDFDHAFEYGLSLILDGIENSI